ncbi:YkvA family protein [Actinobacillus genomosp. 1]|uniref:YkvA family protein n=1 Tax=Actinobacillus genomosp. 1 TaxID=254839 RepID=UPI002441B5DA|nr:YkvA family protein [Actinobacillus genomosp. 1]WGE91144.1 YkvA family protein [Actinobacillus genomosp. 1]WGE91147.1 YkvA family protein [Actinobacillus genomosp. 1]
MSKLVNKQNANHQYQLKRHMPKQDYSNADLWSKICNYAMEAGREVIEKVLILYYVVNDKNTPLKAKTIIWSALGYFILPIDVIPDTIPVVGFSDDLTALTAALTSVAIYTHQVHIRQAKIKMKEWFN